MTDMMPSLLEQMTAVYAKNIDKVIARKVANYERLASQNLMELPDTKAKWHAQNMQQLEEEIQLLHDCKIMADEFRRAWAIQTDGGNQEFAAWAWMEYREAAKAAQFWQSQCLAEMDISSNYLNLLFTTLQNRKAA